MANLRPPQCGTREGPYHYRQQGQHLPAARSPPVTYLSASAGDNYSAGKREGRENAKEPRSPASGLPHSAERQRGHSRVPYWPRGWATMPVRNELLLFQVSGERRAPARAGRARAAPASALRSRNLCDCSLGKVPPGSAGLLLKAEASRLPAVSLGPVDVVPWRWASRAIVPLCLALTAAAHEPGCHSELLRADI